MTEAPKSNACLPSLGVDAVHLQHVALCPLDRLPQHHRTLKLGAGLGGAGYSAIPGCPPDGPVQCPLVGIKGDALAPEEFDPAG